MSSFYTNPRIKHFRTGTSLDMSFIQPSKFNSYGEWRKASNYTKIQNTAFTNLIGSNTKEVDYAQCLENMRFCILHNISPNDLIICLLYLSCHYYSPHATKLISYLLTNHAPYINLYATSISSPQFQIPHIAATHGDIALLQTFYNLNGDINVADGRGVLPITMSISERELQFCECLLWMDTNIPIKQLSMVKQNIFSFCIHCSHDKCSSKRDPMMMSLHLLPLLCILRM